MGEYWGACGFVTGDGLGPFDGPCIDGAGGAICPVGASCAV
jgi:hypothetical protein